MISYRDMTFCKGAGCEKFKGCPRTLTPVVQEKAASVKLPIAQFEDPTKLDCYVADRERKERVQEAPKHWDSLPEIE